MSEINEKQVIEENKVNGLAIAAMILGIVALVLWCVWFVSIPCAIIALVFGILSVKKKGKGMAIAGIATSSAAIVIWTMLFLGVFIFGIMADEAEYEIIEDYEYSDFNYIEE